MMPEKSVKLLKEYYEGKQPLCTSCGGAVRVRIFANENRIGFAFLICESCGDTVNLSRIKVPQNVKAEKL